MINKNYFFSGKDALLLKMIFHSASFKNPIFGTCRAG